MLLPDAKRSDHVKNFFKLFLILVLFSSASFADQLIIEPDAGRQPLIHAIDHASASIDLVMYGLTDDAFIDALIHAKNQGKKITLLLEPAPYKSEHENDRAIHDLAREKIHLFWPDKSFRLTHQKTFILDDKTAIVMTFNLTHASFTKERNFALVITDPIKLHEIKTVFATDCAHQKVTVMQPDLLWSPDNSREKIRVLIQSARTSIKLYAESVTDHQIIGALAGAARRGVSVTLLLPMSSEKWHDRKLAFLTKAGVIIHHSRDLYIHAKVMMIDNQKAVIGSINFTKASLDDNRELSVITEDPNVLGALNHTFETDWRRAE